jgi:transposase
LIESNNLSRTRFEQLYKRESDAGVKERMLLVLNVVYDKHIPAQVARDLHRSKTWASDWLKRYREENIEGLKNRTKSGRPPDIPEETVYEIKKELTSSKQGWTTKQVEDLIVKKSGGIRYHYTFTDSCTSGDSNRKYQEKYM